MSLLTDFVRISIWEDVLREKVDWATRSFWSYMLVQEFFAGAQYVVAPGRPPEPGVSEWRTTPECPVLFDRVHDLAALNVLVVVDLDGRLKEYDTSGPAARRCEEAAYEAATAFMGQENLRSMYVATIVGTRIQCWSLALGDSSLKPLHGSPTLAISPAGYVEVSSADAHLIKGAFDGMNSHAARQDVGSQVQRR